MKCTYAQVYHRYDSDWGAVRLQRDINRVHEHLSHENRSWDGNVMMGIQYDYGKEVLRETTEKVFEPVGFERASFRRIVSSAKV